MFKIIHYWTFLHLTSYRKRVANEQEDKPEKKEKTNWSTYQDKKKADTRTEDEKKDEKKKGEEEKKETLVIKVPFPNEKGCTMARCDQTFFLPNITATIQKQTSHRIF